jgi:hypothetical protein
VEVHELEVDQFDALVLDLTEDVLGGLGHDVVVEGGRVCPPGIGQRGP